MSAGAPRSSSRARGHGRCSVCALSDARALVMVDLKSGVRVTLCGTHELMHRRSGARARTVEELKASFGERREGDRRARPKGEYDELALRLTQAFTKERRESERRTGS